jgi:hypothetical protein
MPDAYKRRIAQKNTFGILFNIYICALHNKTL